MEGLGVWLMRVSGGCWALKKTSALWGVALTEWIPLSLLACERSRCLLCLNDCLPGSGEYVAANTNVVVFAGLEAVQMEAINSA